MEEDTYAEVVSQMAELHNKGVTIMLDPHLISGVIRVGETLFKDIVEELKKESHGQVH